MNMLLNSLQKKNPSFCSAWCLTMTPTTDQGEEKKIYILHSTVQESLRMGGPVKNLRDKGHEWLHVKDIITSFSPTQD